MSWTYSITLKQAVVLENGTTLPARIIGTKPTRAEAELAIKTTLNEVEGPLFISAVVYEDGSSWAYNCDRFGNCSRPIPWPLIGLIGLVGAVAGIWYFTRRRRPRQLSGRRS